VLTAAGKMIDRFEILSTLSTELRSKSTNPPSILAAPVRTDEVGVPGEDLKIKKETELLKLLYHFQKRHRQILTVSLGVAKAKVINFSM
jgi:hypothetical protein